MKNILYATVWTGENQDISEDLEVAIERVVDKDERLIRMTIAGYEYDFDMDELMEAVGSQVNLARYQPTGDEK